MPVLIPALTLYQPHATLVAICEKRIETRPRRMNYRGTLAIHAGLCTDWLDLCAEEPFKSILRAAGYRGPADLPLGRVVCITSVEDCIPTPHVAEAPCLYSEAIHEIAFGNYEPGRWALLLGSVRRLEYPIPARGKQGMWNWEPPEGFSA
jgi:activating signal cointegrator 1